MTTAILIPSLNRPQRLEAVIDNIHANTPEPHRILFCVSDPESKRILSEAGEWFLDDTGDEDHRYVTRMNRLVHYPEVLNCDAIFFGSDDVIHHPGWLTNSLAVLQNFACVVVNDGTNPNGTQALIRTEYLDLAVFDAPGNAFHHGYQHNFADTEQHFTAFRRDEWARAGDSWVEHLHPVFNRPNSMQWDETYTNAQKGWDQDQALWQERAAQIERKIT